jgi:hypothetical protein
MCCLLFYPLVFFFLLFCFDFFFLFFVIKIETWQKNLKFSFSFYIDLPLCMLFLCDF